MPFKATGPRQRRKVLDSVPFQRRISFVSLGFLANSDGSLALNYINILDKSLLPRSDSLSLLK